MTRHAVNPECELYGERFYPSRLSFSNIRNANDPGDIGELGRYRGKPKPYGSCCIMTPPEIGAEHRIEWMADFMEENKEGFAKAGATEITFWIYWEGVQGNMEFTPQELQKIAKLKIPLCINYLQIEEDESDAQHGQ